MTHKPQRTATVWRASESTWKTAVERDLGGRGFESLITRSDDNLAIQPIHRRPEFATTSHRQISEKPWRVVQRVDAPDVDLALDFLDADLDGGATGIELVLAGSAAADRTGFGINELAGQVLTVLGSRPDLSLRLDAGSNAYEYYPLLRALDLGDLAISFDPLAHAAARGGFDFSPSAVSDSLCETAADFLDRGAAGCVAVADGRVWSAGGASDAQEVAAILGSAVHIVRLMTDRGLSPEAALGLTGLVVDAGASQFQTIAKIRALRLCHARLVEAFAVGPVPAQVHAETSWRMMTRYDIHTNMLRATSATMAAGIAGADSITILPCTLAVGLPDALARRLARNTQTILLEESGLASVDDPGSGSGTVEALTLSLAEEAWETFRQLEAAGGLVEALRRGSFQRDVASTRDLNAKKVSHRERVLTGISSFPDIKEAEASVVLARPTAELARDMPSETIDRVAATRLAEPFEALRDRALDLARVDAAPRVFLANLGDPAAFADAAQDAANLFAIAGIEAVEAGGFETPADAARAFSDASANFACINGPDDRLQEQAAAVARSLRDEGALGVYVTNGPDQIDFVDAVIDHNTDVLALLSDMLTLSEMAHKQDC